MDPISIAMGLAQFAPSIIKWVTGNEKAAEAAEAVVDVAKKVTGKEDGDSALAAITADPSLMVEFRNHLLDVEADLDKAYLADVKDARAMQVEALHQDDLFSKRFAYYFASAWSIFSMLYFMLVTFVDVPEKSQRLADTILGFLLGTAIASIFGWMFGTTVRSSKKDETISALVKNR